MSPFAATAVIITTIIWIYALVSLIKPFRPFRSRWQALATCIACPILIGFLPAPEPAPTDPAPAQVSSSPEAQHVGQSSSGAPPDKVKPSVPDSPPVIVPVVESEPALPPNPCAPYDMADNDIVAVTGEHDLRTGPSKQAERLLIKASGPLEEVSYESVSNVVSVRRLCSADGWTKVQTIRSDGQTGAEGWVPNSALRVIGTEAGSRIYVDADFNWNEDTSRYKAQILEVVNKISRENKDCLTLDTWFVGLISPRNKPKDPVFLVACNTASGMVPIRFRPTDAASGRSFEAVKPIDGVAARLACRDAAKARATHPSTISFSIFADYETHPGGKATVISTFTSKNSLNLESTFSIRCIFEGNQLIEISTEEAGRAQ